MPREKRHYIVCVPCWNLRQPGGHAAYQCAHHKCVCCGFKAMEAEVRRQAVERGRTDSGFVHFDRLPSAPEAEPRCVCGRKRSNCTEAH